MSGHLRLLLLLSALVVSPVAAQQRASLLVEVESGSRLRVSTESGRFVGDLLPPEEAATIRLQRREGSVRIALADIVLVEGRGGKDRTRGARWGAAILGTITTTGAAVDLARGVVGVGELFSGFAGGAMLGAAIGAVVAPVGWVSVPFDGRLQVVQGR